jgi:hypothetical protein
MSRVTRKKSQKESESAKDRDMRRIQDSVRQLGPPAFVGRQYSDEEKRTHEIERWKEHDRKIEKDEEIAAIAAAVAKAIVGAPPSGKSATAPTKRQLRIHTISETGAKGSDYCRALDAAKIRVPSSWTNRGCPSKYETAYQQGWKKTIQDEKWKACTIVKKSTLSTLK